jgi:hypothetical protein
MKAGLHTYAAHTLCRLSPSSFFTGFDSILCLWREGQDSWGHKVTCSIDHMFARLSEAVRVAQEVTPDIVSQIVVNACGRIAILRGRATAIGQLIKLGAWVDASLALIEMELPGWKLRRLTCEHGEWFCSLSQQPNLPASLDETADGTHEVMALAILLAFLEARRRMSLAAQSVARAVPVVDPVPATLISCDNFA